MTESQAAALCHLTVRAPDQSIDLAVPSDIPVADLLPALLDFCGQEVEEAGADHGGWVLQRLGEAPFDEEATLAGLEVRDGATLHLRPRSETLPEVHLDDLVDGIATTMRDRPHGWSPLAGRRQLLGMASAAVAVCVVALALPGGSGVLRAVAATVAGLLLIAGAASASRAVGDAGAGAALGFVAVPCLALAGWLLPGGAIEGDQAWEVFGARLLAASAAAAGASVLALAAVAAYPALFMAVCVAAAAGALTGTLMLLADLPPGHSASLTALVAVVFGAFVPSLAFRLSGLRMPPLPTNAAQLQEGIEPHSTTVVAARAVLADQWMTGLYGAAGAVCAACLAALTHDPNLPETLTSLTLCLLLLLHARGLGNVWQRLSLTVPGAAGGALLALGAATGMSPGGRLLLAAGLLALTAGLAIASWTVPGRRLVPYWGRAAELLHSLTAIALLPLALWVLGAYAALRAIKG
ncbi:type VII secretion integral membrane protein EccD [Streptomyces sp. YS415]|uniref:type VII secretion integral membrane protein EccD n=1 Tax=Streptomyces sp. YS415 TaxID=2944806 RepID=UPI00202077DE|nr:type VII secretion integral membrane protein EccD [Streptomyces sp. YS415]MCL7429410.1 type VII secretion integral membrane protein EccD [Streptomyces sp. YS415]